MRTIHLLLLSMIATTTALYADQTEIKVAAQGQTIVAATVDKRVVKVTIKTHEVQIGKPSDVRPAVIDSNCTYSRYPCSIVDSIGITVDGNPLFIPRSVFADLADLNGASISTSKDVTILTLGGGDASGSFIVTIEFNATDVKRRTMWSGEDTDEPVQETTYHTIVMN